MTPNAILFDHHARRSVFSSTLFLNFIPPSLYLTGFHKRKQARAEAARSRAQQRQKQQRLHDRQEVPVLLIFHLHLIPPQRRRALREQAAENARQVEQFYGAFFPSTRFISVYWLFIGLVDHEEEEEWTGIASHMQEYEDDHVLATVTVVQDFDPDTIRHGPLPQSAHAKEPEHTPEKTKIHCAKAIRRKKARNLVPDDTTCRSSRDICPSQP